MLLVTRPQAVAAGSLLIGFVLLCAKLVVGVLTGSLGVISEAAHSGFDLAASGFALFAAFPDNRFELIDIVIGPQGVMEVATLTATHAGRGGFSPLLQVDGLTARRMDNRCRRTKTLEALHHKHISLRF